MAIAILRRTALLACAWAAVLCAGCAEPARKDAPGRRYSDAVPVGFPSSVRIVEQSRRIFETRAPQVLEQVRAAAGGGPINVLALSGGGAGSAFGAGALVGWSLQGTRPEFQIVTGVSSGALIAPFAFLGPNGDERLTDIFSGARTRHLLRPHWASAVFRSSVYRGEPLAELVNQYVTGELLTEVAAGAAKGRLLLVATTDLDKGRTVIWNLGIIAAQGGEKARLLFRDVIVASASIPGVFPPVMIRVEESGTVFDEMHVDGGTTSSLFIAPEIASLLPVGVNGLHGANVYLVVNGQFGAQSETTPVRTIPILKRGITTALQSSLRGGVEIALGLTQRNGMRLRVTEIPNEYPFLGPLDVDASRMKALFDFGLRCARQDTLWATPVELVDRLEMAQVTPPAGESVMCPAQAK